MRVCRLACCVLVSFFAIHCSAQTVRLKETFKGLTNPQVTSQSLPGPQHLQDYVVNGKLRLSLRDAVYLTLANNSEVRIQELGIESAKYSLLSAHQPFDPRVDALFNATRSSIPTTTLIQGAPTLGTLSQNMQLNYSQTFETGTNFQVNLITSKLSTNSTFSFINPSLFSTINFQFTQPLLRNRWLFANRAPLVIARRNLQQSQANFEVQVGNAILAVANQYWQVVQARGILEVQRKSLEQAEASYKRDKRALELGALPPLDIYQSESQVAVRRVELIQAEYALKQSEDSLRLTIGASQDPYFGALDLELTETPEPSGELRSVDEATALKQATARRAEFVVSRLNLANADTGIRLARNNLLPDLQLAGFYSGNGLGGHEFDPVSQQLISRSGFGGSLSQAFGFGFPTYGFTLSLNLPVRNRAAQAELGTAFVVRRNGLYAERQVREQVTLEVSNAVHQLELAKLTLAAGKSAVDLARKTVAAEQRKYELGGGQIFYVLAAQTELAGAELSLLQAEVGYQMSLAAVDYATGGLLDRYGVRIDDLTH